MAFGHGGMYHRVAGMSPYRVVGLGARVFSRRAPPERQIK